MATETAVAEAPFVFEDFKAARNEGLPYVPKPAEEKPKEETKAAPVEAEKPKDDEEPEEGHRLPRSVRRQMRKADMELGAAKERESALQRQIDALMANSAPKKEATTEDPEPQRAAFNSDAEHNRALGRWDARQEVKGEIAKVTTKSETEEQNAQFLQVVQQMDAKALADQKAIPQWADAVAAATELGEELAIPAGSAIEKLLQISDERARILCHFALHPDEFKRLKAMGDGPILIRDFGRLESKVEKLYSAPSTGVIVEKATKAPDTAADRDARKPVPSEAIAPKGGTGAPASTPMMLEDGVTLNPAWKAERNAKAGARQ